MGNHFEIVGTGRDARYVTGLRGVDLLRNPLLNKGSAFSSDERRKFGIEGFLPPRIATLEEQIQRTKRNFDREPTDLDKYQYLRALQDRNETLFFALVAQFPEQMLPIVYTPTVGEAIRQYSRLFRTPRGLTLSPYNIERADRILRDYFLPDVRLVVATDSSATWALAIRATAALQSR
jgi:malate dehydrogenase (oxaloacetate-decarboxylating)